MVFSDLTFVYAFLPICLLAYWLTRSHKIRNYVLLAASMLFYGFGEPVYIVLMLVAAGSAYAFAFQIDINRGTPRSRVFLVLSVAVNVSFLVVYKYAPLFIETAAYLFKLDVQAPRIKLPIGISFYTFQILTYTIDVYRGKSKLQTSLVKFLMYVSMFPQLIAGPIVRYNDVEKQLDKRYINAERFASGVIRFVCGLAKKVLIADYAGDIANSLLGATSGGAAYTGVGISQGVGASIGANIGASIGASIGSGIAGGIREGLGVTAGTGNISTLGAWIGLMFFGFQIYYDFSGYSDMAIGLGRMFGFEFMENFKHPFSSKSITEFWRRWHISLSTFFRDYVYIPLGGNRRFQLRNIAVVWILTGLWHGASWNFLLWGCYFGIILIAEKYVSKLTDFKLPGLIRWAYCFVAVLVSWSIFYFTDLSKVWETLSALFSYKPELNARNISLITDNIMFLGICLIASLPWAKQLYEKIVFWGEKKNGNLTAIMNSTLSLLYAAVLLLACSAVRAVSSFSPFLYFRF